MASWDPVVAVAVAELVAEHTGQTTASVLERLRDASGGLQPQEFAQLGYARELQVAVASVLGPWRNANELWGARNRMARVQLLDEARVAAGFFPSSAASMHPAARRRRARFAGSAGDVKAA